MGERHREGDREREGERQTKTPRKSDPVYDIIKYIFFGAIPANDHYGCYLPIYSDMRTSQSQVVIKIVYIKWLL